MKVTRMRGSILVIAALMSALGIVLSRRTDAVALGRAEVVPVSGAWCGLTDEGGTVRFSVLPGGKFVGDIHIASLMGSLSGSEGIAMPQTQVAESKFIFRRDREELDCSGRSGRGSGPIIGPICRQAPCNPPRRPDPPCRRAPCVPPPPEGCSSTTINEIMVRGTFTSPESARGSFTYQPERRRIVGSYVAWPQAIAPCP